MVLEWHRWGRAAVSNRRRKRRTVCFAKTTPAVKLSLISRDGCVVNNGRKFTYLYLCLCTAAAIWARIESICRRVKLFEAESRFAATGTTDDTQQRRRAFGSINHWKLIVMYYFMGFLGSERQTTSKCVKMVTFMESHSSSERGLLSDTPPFPTNQ